MVDSSEEACSCVCYLRAEVNSEVKVSFVAARVKVAPLKKVTIPRLELMAAVMGSSLANTITTELEVPLTRRVFWSDSKTVLSWIRSESIRYKEFVGNRISRIHELTNVSEWKWVPTELNAADDATRLKVKTQIESDSRWLSGPAFLKDDELNWPEETRNAESDDNLEVKRSVTAALSGSENGEISCSVPEKDFRTPAVFRFSNYNRLLRATASFLKVARFWAKKGKKDEGFESLQAPWTVAGYDSIPKRTCKEKRCDYILRRNKWLRDNVNTNLTPEDLQAAEMELVRKAQEDAFERDIRLLKKGRAPKNPKLLKLSTCLVNGVVRLNGRIGAANVDEEVKFPAVLPSKHHLTELLVMKHHVQNGHQGKLTVLNKLRDKFWIMEGVTAVNRVIANCLVCRYNKAKPITPQMGNLPDYRVKSGDPAFTYTGMDLFGPLEVTVGRHREKRWVYIFTCMVTRALHLEVVYGLSTDETMMALSRFFDQRGKSRHLFSDNGTNFVGAKRALHESWTEMDWKRLGSSAEFQEINWSFTPPCSPHFGGAWERMVQLTKKVLKCTLTGRYPRDQTLLTALKGAENIINSRPLGALSNDPADRDPLTPNHFLRGFCQLGPSLPGKYEAHDEYLRMQWRRAQFFLEEFWRRWSKEVLPTMAKRQKWHGVTDSMGVGDLVFLVDDQAVRNDWQKGFISTVFPGADGQVRVVEVTTVDRNTNRKKTFKRGVDKLIPLGLRMGKLE